MDLIVCLGRSLFSRSETYEDDKLHGKKVSITFAHIKNSHFVS